MNGHPPPPPEPVIEPEEEYKRTDRLLLDLTHTIELPGGGKIISYQFGWEGANMTNELRTDFDFCISNFQEKIVPAKYMEVIFSMRKPGTNLGVWFRCNSAKVRDALANKKNYDIFQDITQLYVAQSLPNDISKIDWDDISNYPEFNNYFFEISDVVGTAVDYRTKINCYVIGVRCCDEIVEAHIKSRLGTILDMYSLTIK